MNIRGDDEPRTVHERIQFEVREFAGVLARRKGTTLMAVWDEALSLHRVQYETEAMPPPEEPAIKRRTLNDVLAHFGTCSTGFSQKRGSGVDSSRLRFLTYTLHSADSG